jgi:hypothetical protein
MIPPKRGIPSGLDVDSGHRNQMEARAIVEGTVGFRSFQEIFSEFWYSLRTSTGDSVSGGLSGIRLCTRIAFGFQESKAVSGSKAGFC